MSGVCTCAVPESGSTNCVITEHRRHAWQLRLFSAVERRDREGEAVARAELASLAGPAPTDEPTEAQR